MCPDIIRVFFIFGQTTHPITLYHYALANVLFLLIILSKWRLFFKKTLDFFAAAWRKLLFGWGAHCFLGWDNNLDFLKDNNFDFLKDNNLHFLKDNNLDFLKDNNLNFLKYNNLDFLKDKNVDFFKDNNLCVCKWRWWGHGGRIGWQSIEDLRPPNLI